MFFDTPVYLVFLVVVVLAYWRLDKRAQNILLLVASYFFYGWWDWRFLLLMMASTLVDYFMAMVISRSTQPAKRKSALTLSLLLNFGFLGLFKYFNFFADSAVGLAHALGATDFTVSLLRIALPPGISFYTFQAVAYVVDVYQKKLDPARTLIDYALFISLFPHLIAGPIQRPSHLLPQVEHPRHYDPNTVFDGLMLIATGLFRKMVIADNCGLLAEAAFGGRFGPPSLIPTVLGTFAFAWQIYGDFSGYSDIARGSAQLLGFHFMVNFRQPYLSTSLSEFWRRWHISLSTWLRDYLYIALGGNRGTERRTYFNLAMTMLLGGLWHGANWTFVVWGAIHGIGLALERRFLNRSAPATWWRRVVVFHFVCLAWIFFRADSLHAAWALLEGLGSFDWRPEYLTGLKFLVLFSVPMFLIDLLLERRKTEYPLAEGRFPLRAAVALAAFVVIAFLGSSDSSAFIYFQF